MATDLATKLFSKPKWGRLTPVRFVRHECSGKSDASQKRPIWLFQCGCGADYETCGYNVSSHGTESCGCKKRLSSPKTHAATVGGVLLPEYKAWRCMLTRAKNPNIKNAPRYSGRGIGVAPEWDSGGDGNGYVRFLAHVGEKPSQKHSLDRIDNDQGYHPGNVRWADHTTQARNSSNVAWVVYLGRKMPLWEAAELSGIKAGVVRDRIKLGWSPDRLFAPRARAEFGRGKRSRPGVVPRD